MPPTRTPNPGLDKLEVGAAHTGDDSARSAPDAERNARVAERLNEAELERILQASALRLQSLVLAQVSLEDEAEMV